MILPTEYMDAVHILSAVIMVGCSIKFAIELGCDHCDQRELGIEIERNQLAQMRQLPERDRAMPPIKNVRQETFCREIIKAARNGNSHADAYKAAGYTADGNAAEACASRLLSTAKVQARIAELTAPAVRKAQVSIESLLDELAQTIADARSAKQHSVVVSALTVSAKLVGLLRDKIEVGGPGDFDGCDSPTEVMDRFLATHIDPHAAVAGLREFADKIEQRLAEQAVVVEPSRSRPSEASAALRSISRGKATESPLSHIPDPLYFRNRQARCL